MGQAPKSSNRYQECDRLIKADFHVTKKNDAMTLITFQNSALQLPSISNFEHFSRPSSSIGQNTNGTHEGQDGQRHSPLAAFATSIREYCGGNLGVSSFHLANAICSSYECTNVKPGLLPLVGYTVTRWIDVIFSGNWSQKLDAPKIQLALRFPCTGFGYSISIYVSISIPLYPDDIPIEW